MGMKSLTPQHRYGMGELGLLDPNPLESIDLIIKLCREAVLATTVAFFVFDDDRAGLVIKSIKGDNDLQPGDIAASADQSASWLVRNEASTVEIEDLAFHDETLDSIERRLLGARGYLGAPVRGPVDETIGVLAAMTSTPQRWNTHEKELLGSFARLLSEQILLRAALQTIKAMAKERDAITAIASYRN